MASKRKASGGGAGAGAGAGGGGAAKVDPKVARLLYGTGAGTGARDPSQYNFEVVPDGQHQQVVNLATVNEGDFIQTRECGVIANTPAAAADTVRIRPQTAGAAISTSIATFESLSFRVPTQCERGVHKTTAGRLAELFKRTTHRMVEVCWDSSSTPDAQMLVIVRPFQSAKQLEGFVDVWEVAVEQGAIVHKFKTVDTHTLKWFKYNGVMWCDKKVTGLPRATLADEPDWNYNQQVQRESLTAGTVYQFFDHGVVMSKGGGFFLLQGEGQNFTNVEAGVLRLSTYRKPMQVKNVVPVSKLNALHIIANMGKQAFAVCFQKASDLTQRRTMVCKLVGVTARGMAKVLEFAMDPASPKKFIMQPRSINMRHVNWVAFNDTKFVRKGFKE
ncbi:hypothetical protein OAM67_00355 [bacterium]|nr:hypothetical protein [bacterium]